VYIRVVGRMCICVCICVGISVCRYRCVEVKV